MNYKAHVLALRSKYIETLVQVNDRNGYEKTALHFIVQLLANLLFHDELNSVDDVKHCLAVLFRFKADLNLEVCLLF